MQVSESLSPGRFSALNTCRFQSRVRVRARVKVRVTGALNTWCQIDIDWGPAIRVRIRVRSCQIYVRACAFSPVFQYTRERENNV